MINNISLIAQSALRIVSNNGRVIYFDPFKLEQKNYDADYIFITHSHFDHFSPEDILKIKKDDTKIIIPEDIESKVEELGFGQEKITIVKPNNKYLVDDIEFKTIPAYNTNKDFHKKEYNWVGYIVNIDNTLIYVAGDTDCIEEAKNVKCDIACVPIGGTYTMTYYEAAELIKTIKPKVAIATHYKTIVGTLEDAYEFEKMLKNEDVEVNILMK